jgi:hypothetical protein
MTAPLAMLVLAMAAVVIGSGVPQTDTVDRPLERATAYVVEFVKRFSNVVAEEQYVQESATLPRVTGSGTNQQFDQPTPVRRTLRSDFLLIRRETGAEGTPSEMSSRLTAGRCGIGPID